MLKPKEKAPALKLQLTYGTVWDLQKQQPKNFTMIVVYRGLHCPICKKYLQDLNDVLNEFEDLGVQTIAISADTKEKAEKTKMDWDISDVTLGYGLEISEARKWNLFISKGKGNEPDYFTEPGLFLIKADGTIFFEAVQSMPFGRPTFKEMINGIDFVLSKNYPARGES